MFQSELSAAEIVLKKEDRKEIQTAAAV